MIPYNTIEGSFLYQPNRYLQKTCLLDLQSETECLVK